MPTTLDNPELYTVGWISALPIERAAATVMLDDRHNEPRGFKRHPADTNSYTWGRIDKHNIVIASLQAGIYGTTSAATTALSLVASLPWIRIGLMVGIGGGIARPPHQDIRLGDVVVSQPSGTTGGVIQYDLGKAKSHNKWEQKGFLRAPPSVLLHAISHLQSEHEISGSMMPELLEAVWRSHPTMLKSRARNPGFGHQGSKNDRLFTWTYDHIKEAMNCEDCDPSREVERVERDTTDPEVHYGIIASGNILIKDARIRDEMAHLAGQHCLCVEMEAAGLMNTFPCLVIRGISDYADSHKNDRWQRYASATAAAYAKELLGYLPAAELEATKRASDALQDIARELSKIEEDMHGLSAAVQNTSHNITLDRLPIAAGASHDSQAEEGQSKCLPNTRVDLLSQVKEWVEDPLSKSVFWLQGAAGTGKSTISRSLAEILSESGHLAASFFFKRGDGDRGHLSRFFTTIAAQLARRIPATATYIKEAIDADDRIADRALNEQFQKLILYPLSATAPSSGGPQTTVILIDALDECELEEKSGLLIRLLIRAEAESRRLKVFVTSRPEMSIRSGFQQHQGKFQDIALHELPEPVTTQDISTFLEHELEAIRKDFNSSVPVYRHLSPDWPSDTNLKALVTMTIPLFIFAATVCRFIRERRLGNPDSLLSNVLEFGAQGRASGLDRVYLPVLHGLVANLQGIEKDQVLARFRDIVGSIVVLKIPLPTSALSSILGVHQADIDDLLDFLHSVLAVPSSADIPVRLMHLSFREFLVDPRMRGKHGFWINETCVHHDLATRCIRLLNSSLRKDMCNIKWPGTRRTAVSASDIQKCIPLGVQYACLYWVHHLQHSGQALDDDGWVHEFLRRHFLHWIEALSLMGRVWDSIPMIRDLQQFPAVETNSRLRELLQDLIRWARDNASMIDSVPLQIYSSGLLFAPKKSIVRTTFQGEMCEWISPVLETNEHWDQRLQVLNGREASGRFFVLRSVSFSHDSALMAIAGLRSETVQVLRTDTGQRIHELRGDSGIMSVIFSPDSKLISGRSDAGTVWVWDTYTGECVREFKCEKAFVNKPLQSVAFSNESTLLAAVIDHARGQSDKGGVRVWCMRTGSCVREFDVPSDFAMAVAFSPTLALLASAWRLEGGVSVHVWCIDTGECTVASNMQLPDASSDRLYDGATISSDLSLMASVSQAGLHIWRIATAECVWALKWGESGATGLWLAFSPDNMLVVIASFHVAQVWRVETGECLREFAIDNVASVALSHDSEVIATSHLDQTVQLWRNHLKQVPMDQELGEYGVIEKVWLSPYSTLFLSVSANNKTIRIFRTDTGECTKEFTHPNNNADSCDDDPLVSFSPDSTLIAIRWDWRSTRSTGIWRVIRVDTGAHIAEFNFDRFGGFSHDSKLVAGSVGERAGIWQIATGKCIQELVHVEATFSAAAFSRDSRLIATASGRYVYICLVATGECLHRLESSKDCTLSDLDFSHDSTLVASLSMPTQESTGNVYIWNTMTGQLLQTFGDCGGERKLAFSHDLKLITTHKTFDLSGITTATHEKDSPAQRPHQMPEFPSTGLGDRYEGTSRWITWDREDLLLPPPGFPNHLWKASGCCFSLLSQSGKLTMVKIVAEKIPHKLSTPLMYHDALD